MLQNTIGGLCHLAVESMLKLEQRGGHCHTGREYFRNLTNENLAWYSHSQ